MHHRHPSRTFLLTAGLATLAACGSSGGTGSNALTDTIPPTAGVVQDGVGGDVDTQNSTTSIRANWSGFSDDSGVLTEYRWAIGTTPGGTEVQPWTSVGLQTTAANTGLSLTVGATCFVAVRAYDTAGNEGQVGVSDGVTIVAGSGGGDPPVPGTATSLSQWGVTWQFAETEQVGQFANGDWWVVGPVRITSISPPTQVVAGRSINGSMVNPVTIEHGEHGYDSLLFHPYEIGDDGQNRYKTNLNVAIGVSPSTPLVLNGGSSLISSISYMGTSPAPNGSFSQLSTAAVLTVLPSAPPAGAFRPPYAGTDKTIHHTESDLDYTALGSVTPATGTPALADIAPRFQRVWLDHMSGWASRYMHPVENMPDYGRDFTSLFGTGCLMLQLNFTNQQKRDLLVRLVQIGIDHLGNVKNGGFWQGVGGQGSGRKFPILLAGAVLNDAEMLAMGTTYQSGYYGPSSPNNSSHFGEDCQTFQVVESSPGVYNWGNGNYNASHVGLPEWGNGHTHSPSGDNSNWTGDPYRRCCTANAWVGQTLAARIMGLRAAWNHDVYFAYMDRFMQTELPGEWTRSWEPWQERMWDLHRANF